MESFEPLAALVGMGILVFVLLCLLFGKMIIELVKYWISDKFQAMSQKRDQQTKE